MKQRKFAMIHLPGRGLWSVLIFCLTWHAVLADEYQKTIINLARTSLVSVEALHVNGDRPMDNKFYGILNAFDADNGNQTNNITYTDWLGSGVNGEWVDVHFTHPMRVNEIVVQKGNQFSAVLYFDDGTERACGTAKDVYPPPEIMYRGIPSPDDPYLRREARRDFRLILKKPADGVRKVRLVFYRSEKYMQRIESREMQMHGIGAREIQVHGSIPFGVEYRIEAPMLVINERTANLAAQGRFAEWKTRPTDGVKAETQENETEYRILFRREKDQQILYRVVINKTTGITTATPLCDLKATGTALTTTEEMPNITQPAH